MESIILIKDSGVVEVSATLTKQVLAFLFVLCLSSFSFGNNDRTECRPDRPAPRFTA